MGKTLAMLGMDSLDRDTMFIHTKGQFMIYGGQRTATGLTYQLGSKWGRDSGVQEWNILEGNKSVGK